MESSFGVLSRVSELYRSAKWHDLDFHLVDSSNGHPAVFHAHRLVLAPCSPVLEALCYGPLAEKSQVIVNDVEPLAFDAMLQYLYTDKINFSSVELASHVLFAAKKYLISTLVTLASEYLADNLSDSNCIDIYHLAVGLNEEKLAQVTFGYICRRLIFLEESFCSDNLNLELLLNLVSTKQVNCNEITLVSLAQKWAISHCLSVGLTANGKNVRNVLLQNKILPNIQWERLRSFDVPQLLPGLLSEDEIAALGKSLREETKETRSSYPFSWSFIYMSFFADSPNYQIGDIVKGTRLITSVKVNSSVILKCIMLIGKRLPKFPDTYFPLPINTYLERLEVIIKCDGRVLTTERFSKDVHYASRFNVEFSDCVVFRENIFYDIEICILTDRDNSFFPNFRGESLRNKHGLSLTCDKFLMTHNKSSLERISFISGFAFHF